MSKYNVGDLVVNDEFNIRAIVTMVTSDRIHISGPLSYKGMIKHGFHPNSKIGEESEVYPNCKVIRALYGVEE